MTKSKLCACGCGGEIVWKPHHTRYGIPKFILGHHSKGKNHWSYGKSRPKSTKAKLRKANLGDKNPNYGKITPKITRDKIGDRLRGKPKSKAHRKALSEAKKGTTLPESQKENIRKALKGKPQSPKHPCNLPDNHPRRIEWIKKQREVRLGRKQSEESNNLRSESLRLDKHWNWRGGSSFEPYDSRFNKQFKLEVRKRDGFRCVLCSVKEDGRAHAVHHIDYDKQNTVLENCVTLCIHCHSATYMNRDMWMSKLREIMVERYDYKYKKRKNNSWG